jgi:hypothetical protein
MTDWESMIAAVGAARASGRGPDPVAQVIVHPCRAAERTIQLL